MGAQRDTTRSTRSQKHNILAQLEPRSLSPIVSVTKCAQLRQTRLSVKLTTQNFSKLPWLSDSTSLSHKYLNRRMSFHPHKMNSLSTVCALSEFVWKRISSMNINELAQRSMLAQRVDRVFQKKHRKCSSFPCLFKPLKGIIQHARQLKISTQHNHIKSPNFYLI